MFFKQSTRCSKYLKKQKGNSTIKAQLKKFIALKMQVPPQQGSHDFPLSPPFNNKLWHYWLTGDLRLVYFYRDNGVFLCSVHSHPDIAGAQAPELAKALNKYLEERDPAFWKEFAA